LPPVAVSCPGTDEYAPTMHVLEYDQPLGAAADLLVRLLVADARTRAICAVERHSVEGARE
jgi:hypothetical protein